MLTFVVANGFIELIKAYHVNGRYVFKGHISFG